MKPKAPESSSQGSSLSAQLQAAQATIRDQQTYIKSLEASNSELHDRIGVLSLPQLIIHNTPAALDHEPCSCDSAQLNSSQHTTMGREQRPDTTGQNIPEVVTNPLLSRHAAAAPHMAQRGRTGVKPVLMKGGQTKRGAFVPSRSADDPPSLG